MSGTNPAATFGQTNYTVNTATVYKTQLDANSIVMQRVVDCFAPRQTGTPAMTVTLDAGHIFDGTTLTEVASQVTGTITAPSGNPRIDRVVIDRFTGVLSVITGTPAGSPVAPAITSGKVPVCQVLIQTSSSTITNSMITDERDLSALGRGLLGELGATNTVTNTMLAQVATLTLKSNITGGTANEADNTLTAIIDACIGSTQGNVLYRDSGIWKVLAPGTSGNVLQTGGSAANPSWAAISDILDTIGSTQGDVLYRGASGWAILAPGTSGQALTTGGASANPSWGSSGSLTLLSTQTATSGTTASIAFSSTYITSTYRKYIIEFDSLQFSGTNNTLGLHFSTNNGSSYLGSGLTYTNIYTESNSVTPVSTNGAGDSIFDILGSQSMTGTSGEGTIKLTQATSGRGLAAHWDSTYVDASGFIYRNSGAGFSTGTGTVNNMKLSATTGTLGGVFKLYGLS